MASDLEEQKKLVLPFMQRAQEIQQADPKVAYYCRMYAVDQALKLPHRAKEITGLLSATLNQLERDKAQLKLDPVADRIHCLGFALRIFDNADRVDRAGRATERTSRAFYAASVFIEILNQFEGAVDAELFEKQRYCAWRAAEIRKAIREMRQPTPPTPPPVAAAAPPPPAAAAATDDLPPASGSSDWAYGRQTQSCVIPLPDVNRLPPVSEEGSFSSGGVTHELRPEAVSGAFMHSAGSLTSGGGDDGVLLGLPPALPPLPPLHERAPPPSVCSSFGAPEAGRPPALEVAGAVATYGSTARFWPGAKLLVHTEEGLEDGANGLRDSVAGQPPIPGLQVGTVGQVIARADGAFSYKVALTDRLVEVPDEVAVPSLQEGDAACCRLGAGLQAQQHLQQSCTVRVLLINYATWPPTYLVQTPDGKEHAVTAQQLAPPPRDTIIAATSAAAASLPPPQPPLPSDPRQPALAPSPPPPSLSQPHQPLPSPSAPPPQAPLQMGPPRDPQTAYTAVGSPSRPSAPAGPGHPQPHHAAYSYTTPAPAAAASTTLQGYGSAQGGAAPSPPALPPGYKPPVQVIMDAQKQAKYAVSALSFEDVSTAVKHLSEALRMLTSAPPQATGHRR